MTETPRLTKNERREAARETARLNREKTRNRQKMLKWLVPTVSSVAILAIAGVSIWAVVALRPAPKAEAGPLNMISDSILFEGSNGNVVPVATPAIQEGEEPVPNQPRDGLLNIVTYIDLSCPGCRSFETNYGEILRNLVAEGSATLDIHPIAILDSQFLGSRYSTRSNNVAACVANYQPESYLSVMDAMFAKQPAEGTTGLNNREILDIVRDDAGIQNEELLTCISEESFTPWVETATIRSGVYGTPTILVNGTLWDMRAQDFVEFLNQERAKLAS